MKEHELYNGSLGQTLIIAGLTGLIDDEGKSFHEAMAILEQIKHDIFPALMKMSGEREVEG